MKNESENVLSKLTVENKPSVLIVDDTIQNLKLVVDILKQEEYELLIANSGVEALEFLEEVEPDLILLDVMMPELDGFEVCKKIKANEKLMDIPVIFLTALSDSEDIVKGFKVGGVDYLTKPFNRDELIARVRNHLELKLYRDLILEQNLKLKKLNAEKNQFLSIAAHDLKNPLNGMYGYAQILELSSEKEINTDEIVYFSKRIKQGIKNMLHIITDLLDINAIEEGKLKLTKSTFNLREVLEEVIYNNQAYASEKRIDIFPKIKNADYTVQLDKIKLQQVFDNLLSNAIKFSPFEKNIWVELTTKEAIEGQNIRIEFKDEGPGIDEDEKSKLFKRFAKISNKPTNKESSSGLGLSIVKEFTELMGGKVWCESTVGNGASFIVEFSEQNYSVK